MLIIKVQFDTHIADSNTRTTPIIGISYEMVWWQRTKNPVLKESGIGVYFLTHTRSRVTPLHLNLHLRISVATSVVSRIFIAATPTCSARCESSARSRRQTRNRLLNMAMGEEKTKIEEGGQKDSSEKTNMVS